MNRTVRDFQNALETLLRTKPFEKITVDQICGEALLHRSSFYRYFHDKYDLLEQLINNRLDQLSNGTADENAFIEAAVNYLNDNKAIFRHLAADNANSTLYTEMLRIISEVLIKQSEDQTSQGHVIQAVRHSDNPELQACALAGAVMGAFYWWQSKNYDVPVNDVVDFIKQSVLPFSTVSITKA
ncbi:TetR/AcrR family transcriptional regulator [uncultured Limosilactobacillus sp.]|uniref:TetR/AcrR family transcriptional regulator n=1 Tax=uncultured Limosilactobacillus sp. TaxID=2837629 RepID=UPI0025DBE297|nr:TetR/AcrR family transcriptional regulator [uncultured Limosilactobacillus sp.]